MQNKIQLRSWNEFKNVLFFKNLAIQFLDQIDKYYVFAIDNNIWYEYFIAKQDPANEEQTDFETSYKPIANKETSQIVNINEIPSYKVGSCDSSYFKQKFKFSTTTSVGPVVAEISFPYDIAILGGKIIIKSNMQSVNGIDIFKIEMAPKITVGQITSALSENENILSVSEDCAQYYIWRGEILHLYNGTQDYSLGRIVAKNGTSITMEDPAPISFASGTVVKVTTQIVPEYFCDSPGEEVQIGRKTHRAMILPANLPLTITWWNHSQIEKDVYFSLEWYI